MTKKKTNIEKAFSQLLRELRKEKEQYLTIISNVLWAEQEYHKQTEPNFLKLINSEIALIKEGKPIVAIKEFRQRTGCSLKDAADIVRGSRYYKPFRDSTYGERKTNGE